MTGSCKTRILHHLKTIGHQIIDLEGLAKHKGSAFGALGQQPQPSSEHFANLLFDEWSRAKTDQILWIEDESRNIGTVYMPDVFYNILQDAPAIILMIDAKERIPGLVEDYATYPPDKLKTSIFKVSKRLGGENTRVILDAVEAGEFKKAVETMLNYYDKTYKYSLSRKRSKNMIYIESDTDRYRVKCKKDT